MILRNINPQAGYIIIFFKENAVAYIKYAIGSIVQ